MGNENLKGEKIIMPKKITKQEFERRIREKFPDQGYEVITFDGICKPLIIKCLKCGRELSYRDGNSPLSNTNGICRHCYDNPVKNKPISQKELQQRLDEQFGQNKYLIIESNGVRNPLKIKCLNCGNIINRQAWDHMERQKELCECYRQWGDSLSEIQEKIDNKFGKGEFQLLDSNVKTKKITIKHKCGFIRTMDRQRFYERGLCPQCNKATSAGESEIARFLTKKNIPYETQKTFKDLVGINGGLLKFDFFVDKKFIIEFNGIQHYEPTGYFGGQDAYEQRVEHDQLKIQYCKEHNIPMLIIPYWDNKKKESIILSFLKRNDYLVTE